MEIDTFCAYPFTRVRLTCEGWVSFCCFMRPDPNRPEADAYLGNVLETPFDEIWFGDVAEAVRAETLEGRLHKKCQGPGCPFMPLKPPYQTYNTVYNEYPTSLEIDLPNTHCNVGGLTPDPVKSPACVMCERSSPFFRPEKNHLFETLGRIKHIMPNLNHIHIQGIAEPFFQTRQDGFLLFDIMDALDYDKYNKQITMSITTNGTLFKKAVREKYLQRVPKSITTFSIDAATPHTFKEIRILDCFDKVLENLYAYAAERDKGRQYLRIHNNINMLNVHEVVGMVQIAKNADVNNVEFNPTNGFNHKILVNEANCGLFARAQEQIIEESKRLGVQCTFIRPLDMGLLDQLVQITL